MPPGPGRRRARPPATSRCCAHPGGTVLRPGGLPPPMPPGRVPPPSAAVLDPGLRPATTRCSWDPVLPSGGRPPPSLVPGPGRPASCPARPPSPDRPPSLVPGRAGLLRPPATTQCCSRPGSAGRARPASPGLRPSLLPVRPATSRCSAGPGCTVLQHGGLPPPIPPGRGAWPCPGPCSPGRILLTPAGSAHKNRVPSVLALAVLPGCPVLARIARGVLTAGLALSRLAGRAVPVRPERVRPGPGVPGSVPRLARPRLRLPSRRSPPGLLRPRLTSPRLSRRVLAGRVLIGCVLIGCVLVGRVLAGGAAVLVAAGRHWSAGRGGGGWIGGGPLLSRSRVPGRLPGPAALPSPAARTRPPGLPRPDPVGPRAARHLVVFAAVAAGPLGARAARGSRDAIAGNPPPVRHHGLLHRRADAAGRLRSGTIVGRAAAVWLPASGPGPRPPARRERRRVFRSGPRTVRGARVARSRASRSRREPWSRRHAAVRAAAGRPGRHVGRPGAVAGAAPVAGIDRVGARVQGGAEQLVVRRVTVAVGGFRGPAARATA